MTDQGVRWVVPGGECADYWLSYLQIGSSLDFEFPALSLLVCGKCGIKLNQGIEVLHCCFGDNVCSLPGL